MRFPLPAVCKPIQKYIQRGFCGHAGCGPPCPARPRPRPRSVSCPAAPRGGCPPCARAVASLRPAGGGPLRPCSVCPAACVRVSRPLPPPARGWGAAIRPAPLGLQAAIQRMLPQSCSNGLHLPISDNFGGFRQIRRISFCKFFRKIACQNVNFPYLCGTKWAHGRHVVGTETPIRYPIMAIDGGILMSGIRRSAGNSTWRRVRGRTIMTQKRQSGKNTMQTRAVGGLIRTYREALFFIMSAFADGMQNSINESFNPTKYGSRRNAFFKLNYSAVEKALNGSPLGLALLDQIMHNVSFTGVSVGTGEQTVSFRSFDATGWNTLLSNAEQAGTEGSYIRANIGGTKYASFGDAWVEDSDPGSGVITGMTVGVSDYTSEGQTITRISIVGTNISFPVNYSIRVSAPTGTPLTGSWSNNVWTPSGTAATQRWMGRNTVYVSDGARVLYAREVDFYNGTWSAGGE